METEKEDKRGKFILANRYLVCGEIARGGIGSLYEAIDQFENDRKVALKLVTDPIEGADLDLLQAEYDCLAHLSHPNVVQIYDFGYDKKRKRFFFTQEFLEGKSLESYLGSLPFKELLSVTAQICQALAHLHERGIIHGDLKPSNILFSEGQVKVIDFGLARRQGELEKVVGGTLPYLAPEILSGASPSRRSDLYSLGVLLFELSTGKLPFEITDFSSALKAHHLEMPIHPSRLNSSLPAAWGEFILRLLNKDSRDRPAEAAILIRELNLSFGSNFPVETVPSRERRLSSLPIVGRSLVLEEMYDTLKNDQTPFLLLQGDTGLGKSRLLKELKKENEKRYPTFLTSGSDFDYSLFESGRLILFDNFDLLSSQEQMKVLDVASKKGVKLVMSVSEWSLIPLPTESHKRFHLLPLRESETAHLLEAAFGIEVPVSFASQVFSLTAGSSVGIIKIINDVYEDFLLPLETIPPQLAQMDLNEIYEKDTVLGFRRKKIVGFQDSVQRAIQIYERLIQEGHSEHEESLAELQYEKGNLEKALEILKSLKTPSSKSQLLLAKSLIKRGDFSEAEEVLLSLDPKKFSDSEKAILENSCGILKFYRGNYEEAKPHFSMAKNLFSKANDKIQMAATDNSLANVMLRLGQDSEGERLYKKALASARKIYDLIGEGSYLMNLGALCQQRRDYSKALAYYYETLNKFRKIGYRLEIPRVLNNLANSHLQMENSLRAKELIKESIALAQEKGLAYLESYGLLVRGDIFSFEGNLKEAKLSYQEARDRFLRLGVKPEELLARLGLSRISVEEGDWASFEKEGEVFKKMADLPDYILEGLRAVEIARRFACGEILGKKLNDVAKKELASFEDGGPEGRFFFLLLERIAKKRHDLEALSWIEKKLGRVGLETSPPHPSRHRDQDAFKLLERLHKIHGMISAGRPSEEVIQAILEDVLELSKSERGLLILKSGDSYHVDATENLKPDLVKELSQRISTTITKGVFHSGLSSFIKNTQEVDSISQSIADLGLKSIFCLPLNANEETIGVIYADGHKPGSDKASFPWLQAFADQATLAILNAKVLDELKGKNKALEEAQSMLVQSAKLSTLGQMAAGIAHEIANPLAVISCHAEMMDPENREDVQPIRESVKKIREILKEVRFFAGKGKPEFKLLDLSKVVSETVELFQMRKQAGIIMERVPFSRPLWFNGNQMMMEQAITNLITNAQDALISKGGGTIRLVTREGSAGWIRLSVIDDGPGIPAKIKEQIFEPFFSSKQEGDRVSGGMGLGLTITMNIVHHHGGRLQVESELGAGCQFQLLLPSAPPPE